jgi:hypothetical protein
VFGCVFDVKRQGFELFTVAQPADVSSEIQCHGVVSQARAQSGQQLLLDLLRLRVSTVVNRQQLGQKFKSFVLAQSTLLLVVFDDPF